MPLDVARLRADFPALAQRVNGRALVYFDSAATAQKPGVVVAAVVRALTRECANVHRGVHALSRAATERFEAVREKAARFLGAADAREIVLTHGATEAVNLVARTFGQGVLGPGDEVLVSTLEHHSNLVPWQVVCAESGANLRAIPLDAHARIDLDRFAGMLSRRVKIVAVSHVSNVTGAVVPVAEVVALARRSGAATFVDGAQAVPHLRVDVRAIGCDFYCFSGHKLFAPPGTGVLYGKLEHLETMPPWMVGGGMIEAVSFAGTTFTDPPERFEAGTPNVAGVIGLGAAIDYVDSIGLDSIHAWDRELSDHGRRALSAVPGLTLHGATPGSAAIFSFTIDGADAHDVGALLDRRGIAVRTGQHCAQPLMKHLGVAATVRASLAFYNTKREIDALARALRDR